MATVKDKPRRDYRNAKNERLPGVTTVLNEWNKPPLVWWAFRLGQQHPDLKSPYEKTEEAIDIGTVVHRAVELIMHGLPDAEGEKYITENLEGDARSQAETALVGFYRWRDNVALEVIDTEIALVSEAMQVGGTIDYVTRINGALALLDLKTAGGIYPDNWAQLAAYGALWQENHPDQPLQGGYYILRIDKDTAGFDFSHRLDLTAGIEVFKALCVVHAKKKELK